MKSIIDCPLEDRIAMEDLLVAYAHAVDSFDIDAVCALFCEGALFDLSGMGLECHNGHSGIREFFGNAFANIAHQAHYLSNFAITRFTGSDASIRSYVMAMAISHDGSRINVQGRYFFDLTKEQGNWRARQHSFDFLLPPPGSER